MLLTQNLLVALALILAVSTVHAEVIRLSEPVATDGASETYGRQLELTGPRLTLAELVENADQYLGKPVLVETKVGKVCQKKGCFFMATQDSLAIRVSFRDYAFFVPTDSGGKQVILEAELISTVLSEDQAAHYRKDTGDNQSAINPGKHYELIADAVQMSR